MISKHSSEISLWMCRPSAEIAPTINGLLVMAWALFWTAQQFVFLRAEGLSKALMSIALWSAVIALFAIACVAFLLLRQAVRQILRQPRLLTTGVVILAGALAVAVLIASVAFEAHAAHDLPNTAWATGKTVILIVLGLAALGWAVWANIGDLPLPLVAGTAAVSLVTCLIAALLASQLPVWILGLLGVAILAELGWLGAHNLGAAKSVAMLVALIASVILLNETSGAAFWMLILPVTIAWITTYVRFGTESDKSRWWLALLQYISWIIVTIGEASVVG
jgi:hypothetical protein